MLQIEGDETNCVLLVHSGSWLWLVPTAACGTSFFPSSVDVILFPSSSVPKRLAFLSHPKTHENLVPIRAMSYVPPPVPYDEEVEKREFDEKEIKYRAKLRAEIQDTWNQISAAYNSGKPFFSKEAIRDVLRQIEAASVRPVQIEPLSFTVSVERVDGKRVDLPIRLGLEKPNRPDQPPLADGVERITAMLGIHFQSVDHLTALKDVYHFCREAALLPIHVSALIVPVDLATGEVVPRPEVISVSETRARMQQSKEKWDTGPACRELLATLQRVADAGRLPRVDKIVAFACGRISSPEDSERSATEHAILLTLRDFFARQHSPVAMSLPCFVQDPVYQNVDREVLGELGMTVLETPRGFLEVDETSLVFSQAPNVPVRQIVADIARLAVMIWDEVIRIPVPEDAVCW